MNQDIRPHAFLARRLPEDRPVFATDDEPDYVALTVKGLFIGVLATVSWLALGLIVKVGWLFWQ